MSYFFHAREKPYVARDGTVSPALDIVEIETSQTSNAATHSSSARAVRVMPLLMSKVLALVTELEERHNLTQRGHG